MLYKGESKTGRPTVVDTKVVKVLEDVLKEGATITQACDIAQISRQSFYNYMKSDEEFFYKMSVAREHLKLIALKNIVKKIEEGDVKTSMWYLEKWIPYDVPARSKEGSEFSFGVMEL